MFFLLLVALSLRRCWSFVNTRRRTSSSVVVRVRDVTTDHARSLPRSLAQVVSPGGGGGGGPGPQVADM